MHNARCTMHNARWAMHDGRCMVQDRLTSSYRIRRKHTGNGGLVGGDGGGEGVGDAEGGEGGVVGVGHVDFEGAAGGGFPEFGDVEGGVVAAAEVGRRVVAAVIKVGLRHFVGGGGVVDHERELTRLCGVGEIELHAYPASCAPEACEPNGVEVPAGKAFGAAAFEAAVGDAAACLHLNGAGGVGGASVGHGVSEKNAVARLGRGGDVACGCEHSGLVGVRTVDGKCGPLGRYGGDFRNVVERGEMHFVGIGIGARCGKCGCGGNEQPCGLVSDS